VVGQLGGSLNEKGGFVLLKITRPSEKTTESWCQEKRGGGNLDTGKKEQV